MDPIYRLLNEPARLISARRGPYRGLVGVEFHDVCAMPVYGVEIAAIRPDLTKRAAHAQRVSDRMSSEYFGWHYV